jgi:hypothetical protein
VTRGTRIFVGTLAVAATYAAAFGLLWVRTRSPAPPTSALSAKDLEILGLVDDLVTLRVGSARTTAQSLSAQTSAIRATVRAVSAASAVYGDAAQKLLSSAQLALDNQLNLEEIQSLLVGELKLCDLARRGLRQGIGPRELMGTLRDIEQWAPKIESLTEEADLGIAKTRFGLGAAPQSLPEKDQWESLGLINVQQQSTLSSQKQLLSEIRKTAEVLKKLVERVHMPYQVLRFPF